LASQHFRNQLHVFSEHVARFREMVEKTWPGLRILEIDVQERALQGTHEMDVRDGSRA